MHHAMQTFHPMLGCDFHDGMIAPIDPPKPMPHFVAATLNWVVPPQKTMTVMGTFSMAFIKKGSDIGMLIPHISPSILAPLCTLASGSKAHFGPSSILMEGTPPAGALIVVVNLNLNCAGATRPPLPSGFVIAPNTIMYAMSLGDILGGLFAMIADSLIQFGINRALGALSASDAYKNLMRRLQGPIIRRLLANAPRWAGLETALLATGSKVLQNPRVVATLTGLSDVAVGFLLGSPLSNSAGGVAAQASGNDNLGWISPVGQLGSLLSGGAESLGQGIGNFIDPPDVQTVN